jgi:hypothetical protein
LQPVHSSKAPVDSSGRRNLGSRNRPAFFFFFYEKDSFFLLPIRVSIALADPPKDLDPQTKPSVGRVTAKDQKAPKAYSYDGNGW